MAEISLEKLEEYAMAKAQVDLLKRYVENNTYINRELVASTLGIELKKDDENV